MSPILVGLITYPGSKYLEKDQSHKEFEKLIILINENQVTNFIINENYFQIDRIAKISSYQMIKKLLQSDYKLNRFYFYKFSKIKKINDALQNIRFIIEFNIILTKRLLKIVFGERDEINSEILRLENITNSHLKLLRYASDRNIQNVMILEDDFKIDSEFSNDTGILDIINFLISNHDWVAVNLSKSYTNIELGINSMSVSKIKLENSISQVINVYEYPIVNTACALLYKQEILKDLIYELDILSSCFFIPIDHKLNIALNALFRKRKNLCYVSLQPGIFVQKSLI